MSESGKGEWRRTYTTARPRRRRWRFLLVPIALVAFVYMMACWWSLQAFAAGLALTSAAASGDIAGSDIANGDYSKPWQNPGSHGDIGYWFNEFEDVLSTMQNTYWNGTYWPTTIQWIGAVLDTLLASSDRSLLEALERYDGRVPGTKTTAASISSDIRKYYSEVEAYYVGEDTNQIFDAAYDDAQWVVLEWLEAIKFVNEFDAYATSDYGQQDIARFAHRAHIFYNIVQDQFDTSLCGGGLTWNPALATYKNAITNELFLSSSIAMYLYFPGDNNTDPYPSPTYLNSTNTTLPALQPASARSPLFLQNAIDEYSWFKTHNFTNAQGLVVDGFHLSANQTTCDQRNEMVYTYNQGVLLSGLRGLWEATGDTSYLSDGYKYIATVINATGWNARSASEAAQWSGLGRNGVMEDYCDAPANCSQDAQIFKGAYFHHLDLFCEALPTSIPLVSGLTHLASSSLASSHAHHCASYLPWIRHNAQAALNTRNASEIIGGWWGAGYLNISSQGPAPEYAPHWPQGSWDEWNQPWVLGQAPWACRGEHGCGGRHGGRGRGRGRSRRCVEARGKRRDVNDQGRGRTVETQGSGLAVVKAVADLLMGDSK